MSPKYFPHSFDVMHFSRELTFENPDLRLDYGVATIHRLLKSQGLFCKRTL